MQSANILTGSPGIPLSPRIPLSPLNSYPD